MAFNFGGGSTQRIAANFPVARPSTSSVYLTAVWFKPTNLSFTQEAIFSQSTSSALYIDPSTGTDLLYQNGNMWVTTSGAGLTNNVWYFAATFITRTSNSTNASMSIWVGTETSPPVQLALSAVSGSGLGGSTSLTLGNGSGNTNSFSGLIDSFYSIYAENSAIANGLNFASVQTLGTFTQAEADYTLNNVVIPLWDGRGLNYSGPNPKDGSLTSISFHQTSFIDLSTRNPIHYFEPSYNAGSNNVVGTITGATYSEEKPGKPYRGMSSPFSPNRRR